MSVCVCVGGLHIGGPASMGNQKCDTPIVMVIFEWLKQQLLKLVRSLDSVDMAMLPWTDADASSPSLYVFC